MAIIGNGITTGAAGLDEMITVSDTQPTVPSNKVWVKETPSEIVVPTADDLNTLSNAFEDNAEANGIPLNIEKFALVNDQIAIALSNGITVTKIGTNKIKLNGTATANITLNLDFGVYELPSALYWFIKCSNGIETQTDMFINRGYLKADNSAAQIENVTEFNKWLYVTYPNDAKKSRNWLRIVSGASLSNVEIELIVFTKQELFEHINSIIFDSTSSYDGILFYHNITSTGLTDIYAHAGDKIVIDVDSNTVATNFMVYPYASGDPYTTIAVGSGKYTLTASKSGYIRLQTTETVISARGYIESRFDTDISDLKMEILSGGEVYTVNINGGGDYTSFTACLEALKNNDNPKTIYVESGIYDIYEEMGGDAFIASITDPSSVNWRDVSIIVPPNTHIIGRGDVTLQFTPTAEQIGSNAMAILFSPLNVSGSCEIENIHVEAKNCRYAIHDESGGSSQYDDTTHIYKNVYAHKEKGTYGNNPTFASGVGARCIWKFENCVFKNDIGVCWTVHTTTSAENDMASITFENCIFEKDDGTAQTGMIQFISGNPSIHKAVKNEVFMSNCYVGGEISLSSGGSSNIIQRYALTLIGNKVVSGISTDASLVSNPYTPEVYMPIT